MVSSQLLSVLWFFNRVWLTTKQLCYFFSPHLRQQGLQEARGHQAWQEQQSVQSKRQGQGQVQGHGQGQQGHRQGQDSYTKPVLYFRFQESCYEGQACRFKHFEQSFLQSLQNPNHEWKKNRWNGWGENWFKSWRASQDPHPYINQKNQKNIKIPKK